ncbi:MAG TPA: cytochrome c [Tepidisphaeraceae bacterium]|nr:cytochrome c [Tepidisphaeraceae bacterium]
MSEQTPAAPQPSPQHVAEDRRVRLGSMRRSGELPRPPFWMVAGFLILVVATWIPLVVFARARVDRTDQPRVHLFQDMDIQPKYRPQDDSPVFADGRAMRLPIPGTVARGKLQEDDHYYRGYKRVLDAASGRYSVVFFDSLPPQLTLDEQLLARGQQRYNIYCATCHGLDGYGNGPVNNRAVARQEPKWVPAASLHTDSVRARPDGHLYNTITNGIRNMPGYGAQIQDPADRWAIVAYLRALQLSQNAPAWAVGADRLPSAQPPPSSPAQGE